MQALKGWRTIIFGALVAAVPSLLTYVAWVDWTHLVSPNIAALIAGVATIGLRAVTTTPPGQSS